MGSFLINLWNRQPGITPSPYLILLHDFKDVFCEPKGYPY